MRKHIQSYLYIGALHKAIPKPKHITKTNIKHQISNIKHQARRKENSVPNSTFSSIFPSILLICMKKLQINQSINLIYKLNV